MEPPPLTLACALVLLGGDPPAATAGGVFTVSMEPRRLVSELKDAIKRKKPHDLRHVDADALALFLAVDGDRWLSDEHDAALALEIRGSPVDEAVLEILAGAGAVLRATKPLRRYFLDGGLPLPEAEQIHLLVVVPPMPVGKRKLRAQEAADHRATKTKRDRDRDRERERDHADIDDDYVDIVQVLDAQVDTRDYPDPPRPLANSEQLYRRMGKELPSSLPLLQRTPSGTDQRVTRPRLDLPSASSPANRAVLPDQVAALLHSRYIHRATTTPTVTGMISSESRATRSTNTTSMADGSSADRAIELMEIDGMDSAPSSELDSLEEKPRVPRVHRDAERFQSRVVLSIKEGDAMGVSPPRQQARQAGSAFAPSGWSEISANKFKSDLRRFGTYAEPNEVAATATMFARLSQFDTEPNPSSTGSRWPTGHPLQSPGATSTSQIDSEADTVSMEPAEPAVVFTEEQNEFISLAVEKRRNLLLVAPAGYGKSAVIKTIIQLFDSSLPSVDNQPVCGLCAPTGKAASLIGGRTLHSYLGIGLGRGSVSDWVKRVRSASFLKPTLKVLRCVRVILIDEISMVSAQFLDRISEYLQQIRDNTLPFGGVQMILVGDLCQLPPVEGAFMFRSLEFARAQFQSFQFTQCFRQNDPEFISLLNEVRYARCSERTLATLRRCTSIEPEYANGLTPMRIVSTNKEVDTINERELFALTGGDSSTDVKTYSVRVSQFANPNKAEAYRKADGIPTHVRLAVGCQVVVTQNLGQGVVNGTQGCVMAADAYKIELRLQDGNTATIEYFAYKDPEQPDVFLASTLFSYMPVRLGYASTVHKAQGMTLQLLEVDLKRTFAHGQLYTALSRVTDLRGLIVKNLTQRAFICSEAVLEFYQRLGRDGDVVRM